MSELTGDCVDGLLRRVTRPGRYAGGEFGSVVKTGSGLLRIALCYPDVYEIGMANVAIKILYGFANQADEVACERVFAPDLDMEAMLRETGTRLFTLETRTPLDKLDMLAFTLGYELTLTNMLNVIDLGGIPIRSADRGEADPIVIAGGPLSGNPAPFGPFVDAVFVGEGEDWASKTLPRLAQMKAQGAGRHDLLDVVRSDPAVWTAGGERTIRRAVWYGFGQKAQRAVGHPVPSIKIVQDNGTVEIMRGCPTGCRFCHAGIFYRPTRVKQPEDIAREVQELVQHCGYHEITLSSLSSADYSGLIPLVKGLNRQYENLGVSFSLPSLKVESVGLDLFAEISHVRRSGVTFALETPGIQGQRAINKEISPEKTISILREAKERGWRSAKFYFMIGLPVPDAADEVDGIIQFVQEAHAQTGVYLHVNVATFIPKPHTPYQWAGQLDEKTALDRIMTIRRTLPRSGFKVGYHSPFTSMMEGVVSRGDGRVAALIEAAFQKGARFDAWEDQIQWDTWREVIAEAKWDVLGESLAERRLDADLPWDSIQIGATKSFLKKEWERSLRGELTPSCAGDCTRPCGVCGNDIRVRDGIEKPLEDAPREPLDTIAWKCFLVRLSKREQARFLSHLDLVGVIQRSCRRGGIRVRMTQGHNPKAKIEFASPLALGITSSCEVLSMDIHAPTDERQLQKQLNDGLPAGLRVEEVATLAIAEGLKRRSLASLYWGSDFVVKGDEGLLQKTLRRLEGEECVVSAFSQGGALRIRHRHIPQKGSGILPTLSRALGESPLGEKLDVHREHQLALVADDEERSPVSFYEALNLRS